jgi:hypothetical protein
VGSAAAAAAAMYDLLFSLEIARHVTVCTFQGCVVGSHGVNDAQETSKLTKDHVSEHHTWLYHHLHPQLEHGVWIIFMPICGFLYNCSTGVLEGH